MIRGLRALHSLMSQVPFCTVMFVVGGLALFGIGLIVYLLAANRWEGSSSGEARLRCFRCALLSLFLVFWVVSLTLILVVSKAENPQEVAVYLVPFDPSSIFIEGYDLDYIMGDLGNWMTAPWIHQRRILVSLLNLLLFLPLGACASALVRGRKRGCLIVAGFVLVLAAGFELAQLVMMSGAVYTDNVLMRFLGGLVGMLVHRLFSRWYRSRE